MPYQVPDLGALWDWVHPRALLLNQYVGQWHQPAFKGRRWLAVFQKSNADRLIKDEIKSVFAVDRWCMRRLRTHALKTDAVEKFVQTVYELHEDEIKRWGGWRFSGKPIEMTDLHNAQEAFGQVVADLTKLKGTAAVVQKVRDAGYRLHLEMTGVTSMGGERIGNVLYSKTVPEQLERRIILSKEARIQAHAVYAEALHYYTSGPRAGKLTGGWTKEQNAIQEACYAATRERANYRPGERVAPGILEIVHKHFDDVLPELSSLYEKLIQLCGERVWSLQYRPVFPIVSVAPSDFLMIGNSRFDQDSCFRTKGMNGNHKIQLAARLRHSFSMWFARPANKEKIRMNRYGMPAREKIVARGWGMALPPTGLVATNFYGLLAADLRPVYTPMLEEAYGLTPAKQITGSVTSSRSDWHQQFVQLLHPIIYFNNDADFILAKGAELQNFPKRLADQLKLPVPGEVDPFAYRNR